MYAVDSYFADLPISSSFCKMTQLEKRSVQGSYVEKLSIVQNQCVFFHSLVDFFVNCLRKYNANTMHHLMNRYLSTGFIKAPEFRKIVHYTAI